MAHLRETLDRLIAAFTDDVIAALRRTPLDEMLTISRKRGVGPTSTSTSTSSPSRARAPAKKPTEAKRTKPRPAGRAEEPNVAPEVPALTREVPAIATDTAERIFVERGRRGATESQLVEALEEQGISLGGAGKGAIQALVERAIIRDAGFRRNTGKGTQPVFVLASLRT
ncbi:MAG: hypothetical protein KF850_39370 [Labilithrix sp.]|nr:hypothetical protein [Labilithrix sp.]